MKWWPFVTNAALSAQLETLRTDLWKRLDEIQQGELKQFMNLAALLAKLQADVAAETTVAQSAVTLIKGIPALIADAVAKAQAAGATPEQLQAFADLSTAIEGTTADLSAAVTAGTPAAGEPA